MKNIITIGTLVVALVALAAVGVLGSEDSSGPETRDVEVSLAGWYYSSDEKLDYEGDSGAYLFYDGEKEAGDKLFMQYFYSGSTSGFVDTPEYGVSYYVYYRYIWNDSPNYCGTDLVKHTYNEDKRLYLSAGTHTVKLSGGTNSVYLCSELESSNDMKDIYSYGEKLTLAVGCYFYVTTDYPGSYPSGKVTLNITNWSEDTAQKKSDVSGTVELTSDKVWVTKEVEGEGKTYYTDQSVFFVKGSDKAKEFYDEYVSKNKYYSGWPSDETYLDSGKTYVEYRLYEGIYTRPPSGYTVCSDNVYKMYIEYGNELKFVPKFTESDYSVYLVVDDSAYRLDSLTEYTYKPDKTGYVYLYLVSENDDGCMGGTIGLDVSGAAAKDDNAMIPAAICLILFALTIAIVVISIKKPKWAVRKTE
jgi:hypothetical protein